MNKYIYQFKSIDVIITTLDALGRWSHTDQFFFCKFKLKIFYLIKIFLQFRSEYSSINSFTNFSKILYI